MKGDPGGGGRGEISGWRGEGVIGNNVDDIEEMQWRIVEREQEERKGL